MNRRVFWGVLAAALLIAAGGWALREQKTGSARNSPVSKKQLFAMDTYMEFTAYGKNCEQAVEAAAEEVQRLDGLLSANSPSSEIYQLNKEGSLEISEDTAKLLKEGARISEMTGGLFDDTIYPVMKLWGFPTKEFRVPDAWEIKEALKLVDASGVKLLSSEAGEDPPGVQAVLSPGQQVDLGGIAKGYTSSRLMEIFRDYDISSGLVSLGGNIQALGVKPDGSQWKIGIRDPRGSASDHIASVSVKDCAVVTSGGYERYFEENGKKYIHIIDPRTGYPAEGDLSSVTIFSGDGTLADALSTALYIMGLDDAVSFWQEKGDDFDIALLTVGGEFYVSEGISGSFRTDADVHVVKRAEGSVK